MSTNLAFGQEKRFCRPNELVALINSNQYVNRVSWELSGTETISGTRSTVTKLESSPKLRSSDKLNLFKTK
jgi:hypothetical protein